MTSRSSISVIFAVHALLFASWAAHIPQLKTALDLDNAALGMTLLGAPLGAVAAMLLTGRLLHRGNSIWFLRFVIASYCLSAPLVGLATSQGKLFLALALWGACQGATDVAMNAHGAQIQRDAGRPVLPRLHGYWSLGALAGAGIGTLAVAAAQSLAAQQLVLGVLVALVAGTATRGLSPLDHTPAQHHRPHHVPQGRWLRWLLTLGFLAFASSLCEGVAANWSAVYMSGLGAGADVIGLGFLGFSLGMMITRLLGNRLLAGARPTLVLALLACLAAVSMSIALLAAAPVAAAVGFTAAGAGVALVVPTMIGHAARVPAANTGAPIAWVSAMGWVGFVSGPPVIGLLSSSTSLSVALTTIPLLTLTIAIVVWARKLGDAAPPSTKRDRHAAPQAALVTAGRRG